MALQGWLRKVGIKPIQIYPGSPWENGYNERFNGTLCGEVLNTEWFYITQQSLMFRFSHYLLERVLKMHCAREKKNGERPLNPT